MEELIGNKKVPLNPHLEVTSYGTGINPVQRLIKEC